MIRLGYTGKRWQVLSLLAAALLVLAVSGELQRGDTAQGSGGRALIGQLEGPEVITDPAKFPKTFKEAPPLAELVKAGKLPPVAERIGQGSLVIKPVHEIGKYGGTPARQWVSAVSDNPQISHGEPSQ